MSNNPVFSKNLKVYRWGNSMYGVPHSLAEEEDEGLGGRMLYTLEFLGGRWFYRGLKFVSVEGKVCPNNSLCAAVLTELARVLRAKTERDKPNKTKDLLSKANRKVDELESFANKYRQKG